MHTTQQTRGEAAKFYDLVLIAAYGPQAAREKGLNYDIRVYDDDATVVSHEKLPSDFQGASVRQLLTGTRRDTAFWKAVKGERGGKKSGLIQPPPPVRTEAQDRHLVSIFGSKDKIPEYVGIGVLRRRSIRIQRKVDGKFYWPKRSSTYPLPAANTLRPYIDTDRYLLTEFISTLEEDLRNHPDFKGKEIRITPRHIRKFGLNCDLSDEFKDPEIERLLEGTEPEDALTWYGNREGGFLKALWRDLPDSSRTQASTVETDAVQV